VHIPDGYLSPETCVVGLAIAVPAIAVASRQVMRQVRGRAVPKLAMLSAFSFLIMMFNLPIPDGTTAHAVGSALIAIVMGPAAAVIATAVALLFQALIFGDGGVLSYGVNVVNMAVIMPLVATVVNRLVAGSSEPGSVRRVAAAAIAGYTSILAASVAVGVELGIQPALFHAADGTALYNPYGLAATLPAILFAHLLIAGPAEAIITGAGYSFLARTGQLDGIEPTSHKLRGNPGLVSLGVLAFLALLTPLGLIAQGTAFGEWAPEEVGAQLGSIPAGLEQWSTFWTHAWLPDYGFASGDAPLAAYWISALIGSLVVAGFTYGALWLANRRRPVGASA
jgi:cobalt/nickel transport system permease protein